MDHAGSHRSPRQGIVKVWALVLITLLWAGCRASGPLPTPGVTMIHTPTRVSPQITRFSATATPTPQPRELILWASASTPQEAIRHTLAVIQTSDHTRDWVPKVVQEAPLNPTSPPEAIIVLPPYTAKDILPWSREHPQVPVLALGPVEEGTEIPPRMLVLDPTETRPTVLAFLAGYTLSLISPNWRAAALLPQEQAQGPWAQAFLQGGWYYCGLCKPPKPPFERYPHILSVSGATEEDWIAAAGCRQRFFFLESVYLPGSAPQAVVQCLKSRKVVVLRGGTLRAEEDAALRAASWSELLRSYLPRLLQGPYGQVVLKPVWEIRNPAVFTPGRMARVHGLWQAIVEGQIGLPEASPTR